jgi:predicted nucleic acid-binding protein
MIVIDTNVLAYLLIQGDRTSACRRVFAEDPEWCAPFLWRSEFRNVLTMHMRHAEMPVAGAMARMAEAEKLVAEREYSISSATIFELTAKTRVSAYDAEFVCLAVKLGTKLLTTDKRLLRDFPELAIAPEEFAPDESKGEQDGGAEPASRRE